TLGLVKGQSGYVIGRPRSAARRPDCSRRRPRAWPRATAAPRDRGRGRGRGAARRRADRRHPTSLRLSCSARNASIKLLRHLMNRPDGPRRAGGGSQPELAHRLIVYSCTSSFSANSLTLTYSRFLVATVIDISFQAQKKIASHKS